LGHHPGPLGDMVHYPKWLLCKPPPPPLPLKLWNLALYSG
jgi:hypothetical protein